MSLTRDAYCYSDEELILVAENEGIVTVLIATAPNIRIKVFNPSFGAMKTYFGEEEMNIVFVVNKK